MGAYTPLGKHPLVRHPLSRHPPDRQTPLCADTLLDGNWSGRCTSYWIALLLIHKFVSYVINAIYCCVQENGIEEYVNTIEILTKEKKDKEKIIEELEMTVQKDKVSNSYCRGIFYLWENGN